jgi:hypothetical protein
VFFRYIRNSATLAELRQKFRNICRNKVQQPQHRGRKSAVGGGGACAARWRLGACSLFEIAA